MVIGDDIGLILPEIKIEFFPDRLLTRISQLKSMVMGKTPHTAVLFDAELKHPGTSRQVHIYHVAVFFPDNLDYLQTGKAWQRSIGLRRLLLIIYLTITLSEKIVFSSHTPSFF